MNVATTTDTTIYLCCFVVVVMPIWNFNIKFLKPSLWTTCYICINLPNYIHQVVHFSRIQKPQLHFPTIHIYLYTWLMHTHTHINMQLHVKIQPAIYWEIKSHQNICANNSKTTKFVAFSYMYVVCSKSIANFAFSLVTWIRFSIVLLRYDGTSVSYLCWPYRPFQMFS